MSTSVIQSRKVPAHSLLHYAYQQDVESIKRRAFFNSRTFKFAVAYWCLAISIVAISFVLLVPWDQHSQTSMVARASIVVSVN